MRFGFINILMNILIVGKSAANLHVRQHRLIGLMFAAHVTCTGDGVNIADVNLQTVLLLFHHAFVEFGHMAHMYKNAAALMHVCFLSTGPVLSYNRRFFFGLHPLNGMGVVSLITQIFNPALMRPFTTAFLFLCNPAMCRSTFWMP